MKNLSDHTELPHELLTSLLIWGVHMGKMSKQGWLMGLVKHVIWADFLCFLYLLLLSIYNILASSQLTL
jgi:hypothetical protein